MILKVEIYFELSKHDYLKDGTKIPIVQEALYEQVIEGLQTLYKEDPKTKRFFDTFGGLCILTKKEIFERMRTTGKV